MVSQVGIGIVVSPSGGQADSAAETRRKQRQNTAPGGFRTQEDGSQPTARGPGLLQKTREAGQAVLQLLRRRTDRGETADPNIEIPPHLERRRAWREAFGVNTYHTQQLAQTDEAEASRQIRTSAHSAYRSAGRRGRLELDLAQQISVTV